MAGRQARAAGSYNPIAFRPTQVTTIITVVYFALLTALLWTHLVVPEAPAAEVPSAGINQTQAWRDLQELSRAFRPANSRRNEEVREWLVDRARSLAAANHRKIALITADASPAELADSDVVIWDDLQSNTTYNDKRRAGGTTAYIESQNVIIYIRGTEDKKGAWWQHGAYPSKQGILVNAHYDSVSTGYGATDDGCGVVTILQLISHYTSEGRTPRKGLILLLNNGEEDGLYGAHLFSQHPWSLFPGVFLNLEGAGAGGRAVLFRSTDAEVTSYYAGSEHPFGTVLSADGFKRGFVRSDTDYTVFTAELNIRGLDVAFMEPRSRYHTDQDSARETSRDSLWHMLSAALSTVNALETHNGEWQPLSSSQNNAGVYFDLFGAALAVLSLDTLSGLCIALLVLSPISLAITIFFLARLGRWYPFLPRRGASADSKSFDRLRGFFRAPIALALSVLALVGLAYLFEAQNPYIVYRSPYVVCVSFLSAFIVVNWTILRLADHFRPTVFSRWYILLWIYIISWVLLVLATNLAVDSGLGSGYFVLIYHASALLALLLATLDFLALPRRQMVEDIADGTISEATASDDAHSEHATERTALLGDTNEQLHQPTEDDHEESHAEYRLKPKVLDASLNAPSRTWLLQFLLLAPINVVLVGQLGLFLISAVHQTPADGNAVSTIYTSLLGCSVLVLMPILPFVHKVRPTMPFLLLLVLIGSLVWTDLAFPFSRDARLKYFFLQQVDLRTGVNAVSLTGLDPYLRTIIAQMPSAAGQELKCHDPPHGLRLGLPTCYWQGLEPEVVSSAASYNKSENKYASWLQYNITAINATSIAFDIRGRQTKTCRILFDTPAHHVHVANSADDARHVVDREQGTAQVRLTSRDWDKHFQVNVSWAEGQNLTDLTGRVGCMWSEIESIPAIKELKTFEPIWSAVTKHDDGLVEGWYDWKL